MRQQTPLRPFRRSTGLLIYTALLALLLLSMPTIARSWTFLQQRLVAPYPNDGLEGTLLYEARLVWAGQALYRPLSPYEFVSAPYPPLFTACVALFDQLPGPSIFSGGRLVCVLSAFGLCAVIILLVRAVGRSWLAGLLGATLFFIAPAVILWATRIKPDMLAIFLATSGLLAVILSERCVIREPGAQQTEARHSDRNASRTRSMAWLCVAAALFALAFFTRQTTVIAAMASGLGLLLNDLIAYRQGLRESFIRWGQRHVPIRQSTLAFGTLLAAFCLGGWWLADIITAGQYSAHVWGLHRSEWWSLYLVQKYTRQLYPYWPSVLLLIPLLLQMRHNPRVRILACYVLLAPVTLLGAAEISAHHNHLLETILALSISLGMALAWASGQAMAQRQQGHGLTWIGITLVLALAAGQFWLASKEHPFFKGELAPPDPPTRFIEFVANTPGEILADDVGLLLAGGKAVRYDDPSTMGPAARWGIWDQRGLLEEIAAKKFSAIMLRDDVEKDPYDDVGRWTREMRQAINRHYKIKFRDKIRVYVPK